MRQAFAGRGLSLQFYHYDVGRWLDGRPIPPPNAGNPARNSGWRHLSNTINVAMADSVNTLVRFVDLPSKPAGLAHTDPTAKKPAAAAGALMVHESEGQLPAYEWNFNID